MFALLRKSRNVAGWLAKTSHLEYFIYSGTEIWGARSKTHSHTHSPFVSHTALEYLELLTRRRAPFKTCSFLNAVFMSSFMLCGSFKAHKWSLVTLHQSALLSTQASPWDPRKLGIKTELLFAASIWYREVKCICSCHGTPCELNSLAGL